MTVHPIGNKPPDSRSGVTAVMTSMTDGERPWVQDAIRSILSQTVLPESVIVLVETANQWIDADLDAARYPDSLRSLIQIHRIPLARLGAVRNTGTRLASTDWVAYLDGDDLWKPERLAWQLEAAHNAPEAQFIGGDFVFIDAKSRPFAFSNGSTPTPSSWMVKRDLMLRHPFDPDLTMGEDFYWLRATRAECPRVRVPRIVTGYRIRGLSLSSVQYGYSRQRKIREAMARAAAWPFLRFPMLAATYIRYRVNRRATYDL